MDPWSGQVWSCLLVLRRLLGSPWVSDRGFWWVASLRSRPGLKTGLTCIRLIRTEKVDSHRLRRQTSTKSIRRPFPDVPSSNLCGGTGLRRPRSRLLVSSSYFLTLFLGVVGLSHRRPSRHLPEGQVTRCGSSRFS